MAHPSKIKIYGKRHHPHTQRPISATHLQPSGTRSGSCLRLRHGAARSSNRKDCWDTIQEQTRQCLENVSAILKAAGTSLDRVVSATVILLEEADFAGMNEEWVKWFPANPPARQGAKLPVRVPGMKISIAAIAEA